MGAVRTELVEKDEKREGVWLWGERDIGVRE
jgi:hypothetical protein